MKVSRCIRLLCLVVIATITISAQTAAPAPAAPTAKISVGILPVYDASGENYGEVFTQNLTQMLFDELKGTDYEPVLLNPGGAYTPLDSDLIKEFAQMAKVDAALITVLQIPTKPKSGPYTLKLDAQLLDPKTGKVTDMRSYTDNIRREEAIVEGGYVGFGAMWGWGTGGSRRFEKQPLGKRARNFAKAVRQQTVSTVPSFASTGSAQVPVASSTSCEVSFRVNYPRKNAISKSYGLIINGKEESLWLKEGIATMSMRSGPALVLVNLADAPYRLPVQHLYAANTYVECSKGSQALALDIGPAGEAFLRWQ